MANEHSDMVMAGFFPVRVYQDGSWEANGTNPLAEGVLDLMLTALLGFGQAIEKISRNRVMVDFPLTPRNEARMVRFLHKIGAVA